jgi:hypothetical protein
MLRRDYEEKLPSLERDCSELQAEISLQLKLR